MTMQVEYSKVLEYVPEKNMLNEGTQGLVRIFLV